MFLQNPRVLGVQQEREAHDEDAWTALLFLVGVDALVQALTISPVLTESSFSSTRREALLSVRNPNG